MPAQSPETPKPDSSYVMTLYGQLMTRSSAIYTLGIIAILPFGFVSLAITTRYLDPAAYGRLAILFSIASVLSILSGVGFLQGTMMSVYGIADGDEDSISDIDDEDDPFEFTARIDSDERRRILASGVIVVAAAGAVMCGAVGVVGAAFAGILLGGSWPASIAWMAASGWTGAVWRMVHQVPRMERCPGQWSALQFLRPGLVVAGTVAALVSGFGINGVLIATTFGTLISSIIAILLFKHCYILAFKREDVGFIWKNGRQWVPLIVSAAIQGNASILLLGVLAPASSVGLFQVASRVAQVPSFFSEGFLTAWPALERSPISFAAKDRKGPRSYAASVFTLFALSTLGLLMAMSLLSGILIHIAAPAYASAAGLIPIIAAAYAVHAMFHGIYRACRFPRRRYWYVILHLLWIVPFLGFCAVLMPIDATYGVALAQVGAAGVIGSTMALLDGHYVDPTPFHWRRLGLAVLMSTILIVLVNQAPVSSTVHLVLAGISLVMFPVLLIVTGIVPREQIRTVKSIVGALLPRFAGKAGAKRRVETLPTHEREAVVLLACGGSTPVDTQEHLGVKREVALARLVRGLRRIDENYSATPFDHLIGEYIVHPGSTVERDAWANRLRKSGVDSLQLHKLDEVARLAKRVKVA